MTGTICRQRPTGCWRTGKPIRANSASCRPNGDVRWCFGTAAPTVDDSGNVVRISGVTVDITDRKEAEERQALLAREVDHRAKVEHLHPPRLRPSSEVSVGCGNSTGPTGTPRGGRGPDHEVGAAQEGGDELGLGAQVQLVAAGRTSSSRPKLITAKPVGQLEGLLLVVGDEERRDADSRWIARTVRRSSMRILASRAPNGSSRRSTSGRWARARASATRCCWPPESWRGIRAPRPGRPTSSSSSSRRRRRSGAGHLADRQGELDVLGHRHVAEQGVVWNTKPTPRLLREAFDMHEAGARRDPDDFTSRTRVGTTARELGDILRWQNPAEAVAVYDVRSPGWPRSATTCKPAVTARRSWLTRHMHFVVSGGPTTRDGASMKRWPSSRKQRPIPWIGSSSRATCIPWYRPSRISMLTKGAWARRSRNTTSSCRKSWPPGPTPTMTCAPVQSVLAVSRPGPRAPACPHD